MIVFKWSGPEVGWFRAITRQNYYLIWYTTPKKPNMVNDMQKIFQVILHILYLSKLDIEIS